MKYRRRNNLKRKKRIELTSLCLMMNNIDGHRMGGGGVNLARGP
jgi:hypothetical protein